MPPSEIISPIGKNSRRLVPWVTALAVLAVVGGSSYAADPERSAGPNIVVFLADDLGWRDVPWHGCDYAMPHLDALAKESLRLEAHYVHPMCSPTRAALLSGRYASRFGCTGAQNERVYPFDTITLAAALKSVGYRTAITGKWHLGSTPEWGPKHFGFDHSYGSLAGGVGPFDHHYKTGPYTDTWHRNGERLREEGHVTDLIAAEAVRFLEVADPRPFFLYVPFTAVHIPIDEPQPWLDRNARLNDPGDRLHAAAATHMDDAIGRILAALDRTGRAEKTAVLFFSDNGGHGPTGNADPKYPGTYPALKVGRDNEPLRGRKSSVYEGGIRSASLLRWPGRVPTGECRRPLHACDWMPTLTKAAGYVPPRDLRWDGIDVLPLLANDAAPAEPRTIYVCGVGFREQMVRHGDWKLIVRRSGEVELYDLARDPSETTNAASERPDLVADLRRRLEQAAARDGEAKVVAKKPSS